MPMTNNFSYKLWGKSYTDSEKKEYFKNAIERLKGCSNASWNNNVITFKNGSCRVNYAKDPSIWFSIRVADVSDRLGIEIKLVMQKAVRLSIPQMQDILETAYHISRVCESSCTVYKE